MHERGRGAEKLARGLYILIREATNARNLHTLLPLVTARNSRRICFCTDDRIPTDLLAQGSIDYMVREAVAYGIDPVEAVRMGALNTAEWFGLSDRGAIAPGRLADLVVVEDLREFVPSLVYKRGVLVAQDGEMLATALPSALAAPSVGSQQRQRRLGSRPLPGAGPGQAHSRHWRSGGPARHR